MLDLAKLKSQWLVSFWDLGRLVVGKIGEGYGVGVEVKFMPLLL